MLDILQFEALGFDHAIRGMRNPKNSWFKSDSCKCAEDCSECENFGDCSHSIDAEVSGYSIGANDLDLTMRLAKGGPVHAKYRRMITVYVDINAPLYWWKEYDTYKVGTVSNSCSTMHKIHAKEFVPDDFSHERLNPRSYAHLLWTIDELNHNREQYLETKDKHYWEQMIQLLPSSYNQKRTLMLNYEVLHNIYESRRNHKLTEWHDFCNWIESLPYNLLITMKGIKDDGEKA